MNDMNSIQRIPSRTIAVMMLSMMFLTLPATPSLRAEPPAPDTQPANSPLDRADRLYQQGLYDEAIDAYQPLRRQEELCVAAAVGTSRAQTMLGHYADALDSLQAVAEPGQADAVWRLQHARALCNVGRYADALEQSAEALRLAPAWAPAVQFHGELLELLGRDEDALETYRRMETIVESSDYRDDPESLVALGEILERYAALHGLKASDQARNILHNYFQEAYLKVDKEYWPAHVAAGWFLLRKHKASQAGKEFELAEKLNRRLPDTYAGKAMLYLQAWAFEKSIQTADQALKINPHHPEALLAKAACFMQWRKFQKVPPILEHILEANPYHLEALSMMAAAYIRMDLDEKAEPYMAKVREVNPRCALLPATIGEWLVAGRQFEKAEAYLREAVDNSPKMAEPLASLGEMYMQTGEEDKALDVLEKAHALDDFREDVVNYLNVCRKLQDFEVLETEHFIIKVDPEYDKVLLDEIATYMEEVYPEVTGDYGHEPEHKITIEVLPFQDDFSRRIAGRSWIPTVGACTGRVIAIAAPHKQRGDLGRHNWAAVLRHEFAHAVTLEGTNNRIPHWFTEACAVWQQQDKRSFQYIRALVDAVHDDRLMPVQELDWGFIRPKYPQQRLLAYCQSEWIMDYIIRTQGFGKIQDMLEAFATGTEQAEVFTQVLGMSERQFNKAFEQWARQQIREWGFDFEGPPDAKKAMLAAKLHPNNAEAQARHALALLHKGKLENARQAANRALTIDEDNLAALRVLANLELQTKKYDLAIELCMRIEKIDSTTRTVPHVLARAYLAKKDWAHAIAALELLQKRHPLDSFSYEQLAKMYMQFGQPELALPNLLHLHIHSMDDPQYARQIADIYRSLEQYPQALYFYRQVTHIDPYEISAYEGRAGIFVRQKDFDKARTAAEKMTLVEPDNARSWSYLAKVLYRMGKDRQQRAPLDEARQAALRAQTLRPDATADRLLEYIDAALTELPAAEDAATPTSRPAPRE